MKKIIKKSFQFNDESYLAECDVEFHTDDNYGADADGNRGVFRLFIDEVTVLSIENEDNIFLDDVLIAALSEYFTVEPEDVLN